MVENLDTAIKMARRYGYGFRIVTLEGDILSTTGSMSGGSNTQKESGILGRNREVTELSEAIEKLKSDEEALEKSCSDLSTMLSDVVDEIADNESNLKNNELIKIRDESHLAQVDENINRILARIDMLKQEKEQLIRQEKETCEELRKYEDELTLIEKDIEETRNKVAQNQEKSKEQQSIRDKLHADITDYKISVNSILESKEAVKESLERIQNEKLHAKGLERRIAEKNRMSRRLNH